MVTYLKSYLIFIKCHCKHLWIFCTTLLIVCLFATSCNNTSFSSEIALLNFIQNPENEYSQSKTVNGIRYRLQYRPTDLLVRQDLGNQQATKDQVRMLREKYNKYIYFNLSMSKKNQELLNTKAGNKNEFGAMVNQLAFGMNEKVHLFTKDKDTIPLIDFIYPRMYGMSKSTTILFVYPRNRKTTEEELNFSIEDLGFYTGEVKFKINAKQFNNEPQLSFKN